LGRKGKERVQKKDHSCQSIAGNKIKRGEMERKWEDRSKTFKIKSQIYTDMSGEKGYMSTRFMP
jgi:hypothetical protein